MFNKKVQDLPKVNQHTLKEHARERMLRHLEANYIWSSTWCGGRSILRWENTRTPAQWQRLGWFTCAWSEDLPWTKSSGGKAWGYTYRCVHEMCKSFCLISWPLESVYHTGGTALLSGRDDLFIGGHPALVHSNCSTCKMSPWMKRLAST